MKNSKFSRLTVVLLVICIATTGILGVTFAKYISETTKGTSVTVAKWDIELNGEDLAVANPAFTFNLFETIKSTNDAAEVNVKSGLIAPGTKGEFKYDIANKSEVKATYAIDFTETNTSNVPIQYSLDKTTWKDDISQLDIAATDIAMESGTASITVYWQWTFAGDDTADTSLGVAAQDAANVPTVAVTAKITATQVD